MVISVIHLFHYAMCPWSTSSHWTVTIGSIRKENESLWASLPLVYISWHVLGPHNAHHQH